MCNDFCAGFNLLLAPSILEITKISACLHVPWFFEKRTQNVWFGPTSINHFSSLIFTHLLNPPPTLSSPPPAFTISNIHSFILTTSVPGTSHLLCADDRCILTHLYLNQYLLSVFISIVFLSTFLFLFILILYL